MASEALRCVFVDEPAYQRHITPNVQIRAAPSGSFDTDKHSIGSMKDASVRGSESRRARISLGIAFFSKTKAG